MKYIGTKRTAFAWSALRTALLSTTVIAVAGAHSVGAQERGSGFLITVINDDAVGYDSRQRKSVLYDENENPVYDKNGNYVYEDIFHIALVDITARHRQGDNVVDASGDFGNIYVNGRVAFYLKGKIKGEYLITASADTDEGPLKDIFRDFDAKDPHSVLDRLDPDEFYPIYGDDSSIEDDAPTNGKFYIRIERGDDSILWGNYTAAIEGTEYLHNRRTFYGAVLKYNSDEKTDLDAPRTSVIAYAAQPETAPQRDVFLGTGGSAYFLRRQDIRTGSEVITVVVRDITSGHVLQERVLRAGDDYDIDYVQGMIILKQPVHASTGADGVVRDGTFGDTKVSLVAQYDYSPTLSDIDGFTYGGRIEHWVNDRVSVGVTGLRDNSGVVDQRSIGANIHVLLGEKSTADFEYAQTRGSGYGSSSSGDGGLTFNNVASAGTSATADAYIARFHGDLTEILGPSVVGNVDAYYENQQAGFSTLDHEISVDQQSWGIKGNYQVSDRLALSGSYDGFSDATGNSTQSVEVGATYTFTDQMVGEIGVQNLDKVTIGNPAATGNRTDVAAHLSYKFENDRSIYGFAQATITNVSGLPDNNRYGFGGDYHLTEKINLKGEISSGTSGFGAQIMVDYQPNDEDHFYIGYRLDPGRQMDGYTLSGNDEGSIVVGARSRYNDHLSGYAEQTYDLFGARRSETAIYGLTYTPTPHWTLTGGLETGKIRDDENGNFDRFAPSFGVAYHLGDQMAANVRFEGRRDDGEGIEQDRTTYLVTSQAHYKFDESRRLLFNADAVYSDSDQSSLLDGEFLEVAVGYAYRPILNDRLNVLFKYTYLYDMPGPDQLSVDGTTDGPKQKSSILSVDATYDINEKLSIGAKYGYRMASVADRGSDVFTSNTAHLGVLRADFHIVHEWDAMIEGRALFTEESDITETGATVALYRHFGDNFKAGVGYHFGNVSSDLRNINNTDNGLFFNVVAKF